MVINKKLQKKTEFTVIPIQAGPKKVVSARMDHIWAPIPILVEAGIIIDDKIGDLRRKYARMWTGAGLGNPA